MTDLIWTSLALIAKGLSPTTLGATSGTFVVAADTDRSAIEVCLNHHDKTGLEVMGGLNAASVGSTVALSFDPKPGWASVARDMDDLLSEPENRVRAKPRFLVLSTKESSDDAPDPTTEVGRYLLILSLVQALKEAAGFLDTVEQNLVFISSGRFDLPVNYRADDLRKMHLDEVRALTTLIPTDTHKKQCVAILATAIVDLVRSQPTQERFAYLLTHAKELRAAYDQGYKIYAAGFSYEKLKDTIEAARVEFAGKIHKVLSDVQNQLLGIPVATIIVATQMKAAPDFGTEFIVNSAVLLGAWVFVLLTLLLLVNQFLTLVVIEGEIYRQKGLLEKEYAAVANQLEMAFASLRKRAFMQKIILGVIGAVVFAGLIMAHWAYSRLTPLAWARIAGTPAAVTAGPGSATSTAPQASTSAATSTPALPVSGANASSLPRASAPVTTGLTTLVPNPQMQPKPTQQAAGSK